MFSKSFCLRPFPGGRLSPLPELSVEQESVASTSSRFEMLFGDLAGHLSSVIYFRHNDMQDCVIKLGKWYQTAVAEARGRLFVCFFLWKLAEANAM